MKKAKPVLKFGLCQGIKAFGGKREKSIAQDEMHAPYIRSKRNATHLPDGWDDTKWIKRQKSWKYRCKKRHQWEKHQQTPEEVKITSDHYPEKYIIYLYGHSKRWTEIKPEHRSQVESLINRGVLEGKTETIKRHFFSGGNIPKHYYITYIKYARKKFE